MEARKPNKMKCERVQEDAIALLGVELTDDEEQAIYAHMSNCPQCREQFRRDRKIWRAISACPPVTADPSFDRMLWLRLALEEHEPRPEQVDRVLPELVGEQDTRYDPSRLASVFASAMLQ